MRAPEAPSGWPIAIAPPRGLTFSGSSSGQPAQAGERLRRERLVELDGVDVAPADARPARAPCWPPRPGAMPKTSGSTPCAARETIRASGSTPSARAGRLVADSSAAAPSLSGEVLPAVTVPPATNAGLSFASFSSDVSARIPSSRSRSTPGTGTTSARSTPSSHAAPRSRWLRSANSSCCLARDRRSISASFSALSPSEIVHCVGHRAG